MLGVVNDTSIAPPVVGASASKRSPTLSLDDCTVFRHRSMTDHGPGDGDTGASGLQSTQSARRLQQISSLRAREIREEIDLPQLVVCGDQSASKSSVLDGITSIPFPREGMSATIESLACRHRPSSPFRGLLKANWRSRVEHSKTEMESADH